MSGAEGEAGGAVPAAAGAARRGPYRWLFAWLMSRLGPRHDAAVAEVKQRLLGSLQGTVLELGPGTGVNLAYLPAEVRYVGVEPNLHMHAYLRQQAAALGRAIELRTATGERLPAPDASVDAVLSTIVLCSVTDVAAVLGEILRVLRPGGRFVFVEHVAAPAGSRLRRWQRRIRPLWRRIGDGCHPDRDLESAIRAAGFARVQVERFDADLPVPIVRPHIAGFADKAV